MMKSKGWQTLAHRPDTVGHLIWYCQRTQSGFYIFKELQRPKEKKHTHTKTQVICGHKAKGRYSSAIYIYKKILARKDKNFNLKRYMHPYIHSSTIHNSHGSNLSVH